MKNLSSSLSKNGGRGINEKKKVVYNGNNGGRDVQWSNEEVQNGKNGGRTIKGNINGAYW